MKQVMFQMCFDQIFTVGGRCFQAFQWCGFDMPPSPLLDSKESNYVRKRKEGGLGAAPSFQH